MARIKITDLPRDQKISKEQLKVIFGGPTRRKDIDYIGLITTLESEGEKDSEYISSINIE